MTPLVWDCVIIASDLEPYEGERRARLSCDKLAERRFEPHDIDCYLHNAARDGNLERVKAAVERLKYDPTMGDDIGESPLLKAVRCGEGHPISEANYYETAKYLANRLKKDRSDILDSALYLASNFAETRIIEILIELDAKVIDPAQMLYFASREDSALEALLKRCQINENTSKKTALNLAIKAQRIERVRRLLEHGTGRCRDKISRTYLAQAIATENGGMIELLMGYS